MTTCYAKSSATWTWLNFGLTEVNRTEPKVGGERISPPPLTALGGRCQRGEGCRWWTANLRRSTLKGNRRLRVAAGCWLE